MPLNLSEVQKECTHDEAEHDDNDIMLPFRKLKVIDKENMTNHEQ